MRQKDLSAALQISPQQLSELLAGRSKSTGIQALRIFDFLSEKTLMIPTDETPMDPYRDRPKTLAHASSMLDRLREELKLQSGRGNLPRIAEPNLPKPKASTGNTNPTPLRPESDPAFKKVEDTVPLVPKTLPASANTVFLISEILKKTNLEDLLSMLGNPALSNLQRSCVYNFIREIRAAECGLG